MYSRASLNKINFKISIYLAERSHITYLLLRFCKGYENQLFQRLIHLLICDIIKLIHIFFAEQTHNVQEEEMKRRLLLFRVPLSDQKHVTETLQYLCSVVFSKCKLETF